MRSLPRFVSGLAGVALALASGPASAVPVTFELSGTLTQVSDPRGLLPASLAPGTAFNASLSFDADPACLVVSPSVCQYLAPVGQLSLVVGSETVALVLGSAYAFVQDGAPVDGVSASLSAPLPPGPGSPPIWRWADVSLQDPSATALASRSLPLLFPDLGLFSVRSFDAGGCYAGCGDDPFDRFRIAGSLSAGSVVPEPSTALLLGVGFAALAARSRKGGPRR
jgi:hypothetical protein